MCLSRPWMGLLYFYLYHWLWYFARNAITSQLKNSLTTLYFMHIPCCEVLNLHVTFNYSQFLVWVACTFSCWLVAGCVVPPEDGRLMPETCSGLRHNKVFVKVKVYYVGYVIVINGILLSGKYKSCSFLLSMSYARSAANCKFCTVFCISRHSRKPTTVYTTSRSGSLERGSTGGAGPGGAWGPAQPFVADPSMPPLPVPHTDTQLEEARRRLLEEDGRPKTMRQRYLTSHVTLPHSLISGHMMLTSH
jgi:hypothetical protein